MKVIDEGHAYELENFEGSEPQTIVFIKKEAPSLGGDLVTVHDGTTNEDILKVLINRMKNLQTKFPCRQNAIAITKLEESLMWLNNRTEERQARNVEGKHLA